MTAALRARAALIKAGLTEVGQPTRAPNSVNEVWFAGPYVLRIAPIQGRRRPLQREARLLEALVRWIPVARLVDYGEAAFGEWLVQQRVPGQELSRTWLNMKDRQREDAITALGQTLSRLHSVEPSSLGLPMQTLSGERRLDWPHQLPVDRLLDVLARAARLPHVDSGVIRAAVDLVNANAAALDERPSATLVHGDLHFENVLWDGDHLTAILDWEWARPGPADLDLDVLLHSLSDPALHVATDYAGTVRRRDFEHVTQWLRAGYPQLFAHPRLVDRLTVYRIAYDARALVLDPPDQRPELLSPHHPYHRLQRVVEGRSDLRWILAS